MGWSEISFDDKVRENSEMGFYSSFTSPPTSLYLYLKQVHARTKNSSLFLTTVCLFCGFFEGIVETRNTESNVQDIRWRQCHLALLHVFSGTEESAVLLQQHQK